jgi:hypothetical protein
MYSAFLTPRLRQELRSVWGRLIDDDAIAGIGKIQFSLTSISKSILMDMYYSTYETETARINMTMGMNHPSRIDYLHRYLAALRPGHRLAAMHSRETGILAPFAADLSGFIYPNRLVSQSLISLYI